MLKIDNVTMGDYGAIVAIEMMGFKLQAGTPAKIQERIEKQSDTFLIAREDQRVVGLIIGTVSDQNYIQAGDYQEVTPNSVTGGHQLVLAIAMPVNQRDQGISEQLLASLKKVARNAKRESISLLSLENDVSFYEKNGFQNAGPSELQPNGNTWYNMIEKL